jgi:NAD+--asparagine ADP-ribosyltransferase
VPPREKGGVFSAMSCHGQTSSHPSAPSIKRQSKSNLGVINRPKVRLEKGLKAFKSRRQRGDEAVRYMQQVKRAVVEDDRTPPPQNVVNKAAVARQSGGASAFKRVHPHCDDGFASVDLRGGGG